MFQYPALYDGAGALSARSQSLFLRLVKAEYGLLVIAAVLSLNLSKKSLYFIAYALVFIGSLSILLARHWLKPEQDWYKGRALAESVKTSAWRYCMRAEPFGDAPDVAVRREEFRSHLHAILKANSHIGNRMPADYAVNQHVTASMETARALSLADRKALYTIERIDEQKRWYTAKAKHNRLASRKWLAAAIIAYCVAISLAVFRVAYPEPEVWPIEPVIVLASSIIGWTQVKKYNELASSYTLTAYEIGIIQGRVSDVSSERDFSNFVNEAEQAFSREHTQWVARQQSQ